MSEWPDPGYWEPIERSEAEDAVDYARKVRSIVRNALPKNIFDK
jgi:HEPN domain-containing protein